MARHARPLTFAEKARLTTAGLSATAIVLSGAAVATATVITEHEAAGGSTTAFGVTATSADISARSLADSSSLAPDAGARNFVTAPFLGLQGEAPTGAFTATAAPALSSPAPGLTAPSDGLDPAPVVLLDGERVDLAIDRTPSPTAFGAPSATGALQEQLAAASVSDLPDPGVRDIDGIPAALLDQARASMEYPNGHIPADLLCSTGTGWLMRCDAAFRFDQLNEAYRAVFGTNIPIADAYRSYDGQVLSKQLYGGMAATPGTSNHGWGLAVDLGGVAGQAGTAEHAWLVANAPSFGWWWPSWMRVGDPAFQLDEPWHFEFREGMDSSLITAIENARTRQHVSLAQTDTAPVGTAFSVAEPVAVQVPRVSTSTTAPAPTTTSTATTGTKTGTTRTASTQKPKPVTTASATQKPKPTTTPKATKPAPGTTAPAPTTQAPKPTKPAPGKPTPPAPTSPSPSTTAPSPTVPPTTPGPATPTVEPTQVGPSATATPSVTGSVSTAPTPTAPDAPAITGTATTAPAPTATVSVSVTTGTATCPTASGLPTATVATGTSTTELAGGAAGQPLPDDSNQLPDQAASTATSAPATTDPVATSTVATR